MVKYGSSVKVTIKPIWDDGILFEETLVLSNSPASRKELERIVSGIKTWFEGTVRRSQVNISDNDLLALVRERGLIASTDLAYPHLYYVDSFSGRTKGHYIELYRDGTVSCTCPGFVNSNKCWATTEVLAGKRIGDTWASDRNLFYQHRSQAYFSTAK